jgi:hypothetical protein
MGLQKWYVGDGLPLCADLPSGHFLRKGATYRLLGSSSTPRLLSEPSAWAADTNIKRLLLPQSSMLFEKLCNRATSTGPCRYRATVVLTDNLSCIGVECTIESPRVLEVRPGVYYEYTRVPCVQQAFYNNAKAMKRKTGAYFCGDPRLEAGALGCCSSLSNIASISLEKYAGERLTLSAATQRCAASGLGLCQRPSLVCSTCNLVDTSVGYWTSQSCNLKVKIDLEGNIAIVHSIPDATVGVAGIYETVREDAKTFFRVDWNTSPISDLLADYTTKCAALGCGRDTYDNLCLCPVNVAEVSVFSVSPTRDEVLTKLYVGAFNPSYYGTTLVATVLGDGVTMHSVAGQFSKDSIFEVVDDNGVTRFRKNIRSVVAVGNSSPNRFWFGAGPTESAVLSLSFRNPPHMSSFTYPDLRDAQYETDAGLDHYFVSFPQILA